MSRCQKLFVIEGGADAGRCTNEATLHTTVWDERESVTQAYTVDICKSCSTELDYQGG